MIRSTVHLGRMLPSSRVRSRIGRSNGARPFPIQTSLLGLLLGAGLLLAGSEAQAQTCSSITIERPDDHPIGTCLSDSGRSCTSDSQCTSNANDFCLHGVSASNSNVACYTNDSSCLSDITFRFDREYACGQYVTGDWWVQADATGRLRIQSITPTHTPGCEGGSATCMHGWEKDQPMESQSLSSRPGSSAAALNRATPSLPHTLQLTGAPVSILKGIDAKIGSSLSSCAKAPCLMWAGVLTVVQSPPPSNAFRPPYAGPGKPARTYTTSDVRYDRLPGLSPQSLDMRRVPSVRDINLSYSHPWIGSNHRNNLYQEFVTVYQSRLGGPGSQTSGYHAARTGRTNDALLRMTLEDLDFTNDADARMALHRLIQLGIDHSWVSKTWTEGNRRRIKNKVVPIGFSAWMLNDPSISDTNFPGHSEQDTIYISPKTGDALWGYPCTEEDYWSRVMGTGDKWCGDPYGYVDQDWYYNDSANSAYQWCCSSQPWKGGALLTRLIGNQDVLRADAFLEYTDRWVQRGYHNRPDPCARHDPRDAACTPGRGDCRHYGADCPSGDCTWGPAAGNSSTCHADRSCECIGHGGDPLTDGRLPSQHGTSRDDGAWGRSLSNDMWDTFRSCAESGTCPGSTRSPTPTEPTAPTPPRPAQLIEVRE